MSTVTTKDATQIYYKELLITLDDPGEDDLEEDTFNHSQTGNTVAEELASRTGVEPVSPP